MFDKLSCAALSKRPGGGAPLPLGTGGAFVSGGASALHPRTDRGSGLGEPWTVRTTSARPPFDRSTFFPVHSAGSCHDFVFLVDRSHVVRANLIGTGLLKALSVDGATAAAVLGSGIAIFSTIDDIAWRTVGGEFRRAASPLASARKLLADPANGRRVFALSDESELFIAQFDGFRFHHRSIHTNVEAFDASKRLLVIRSGGRLSAYPRRDVFEQPVWSKTFAGDFFVDDKFFYEASCQDGSVTRYAIDAQGRLGKAEQSNVEYKRVFKADGRVVALEARDPDGWLAQVTVGGATYSWKRADGCPDVQRGEDDDIELLEGLFRGLEGQFEDWMAGYDRLIGRVREVFGGLRSRFKRRPRASDFGAMPSIRVSGDQVALIQSPVTHDLLVVKPFDTADVDSFARWVEALRELAHPCLAEIVAFSLDPPQIATRMAMNGSLKEAIEQRRFGKAQRFMDDTGIAIIVCGIVLGMQYIHSKGVVHGGLTPESVLIDENGFPKIGGFLPTGAKRGADIALFARILSELTARDANCVDGPEVPAAVNKVVRDIIVRNWDSGGSQAESFDDIWGHLQGIEFQLTADVKKAKVLQFVAWARADASRLKVLHSND